MTIRTGRAHKGWFLNQAAGDPTQGLAMKWGIHPAGDQRPALSAPAETVSVAILIHGRFVLDFPGHGTVELRQQGDWVQWPPGVTHTWWAVEASTVLTIRWQPGPRQI
ncbi:signal peptidase I [Streptomyces sp. NPDC085596]|uniref:signal peptidase I n=1 Tax=Streptomyces sp. NPDC085596 TaxID=3365731 RepID=UPI0037CD2490